MDIKCPFINFTEMNLCIKIGNPPPKKRGKDKEICPAPFMTLCGADAKNKADNHQKSFKLNQNKLNGVHNEMFLTYNLI